jgi:hypothetical protein
MLQPFHALSNTYCEMVEPIYSSLLAQYQASSGHLIELLIVGNISLVQKWTAPSPVTSLHVLSHAYHEMVEPMNQVYWPNIKLLLAIR